MVKTKVLFYDVPSCCESCINLFTDNLFDKSYKEVGTLQVNIFRQNRKNVQILTTIILPNLTINYNYVRSGKKRLLQKRPIHLMIKKILLKDNI